MRPAEVMACPWRPPSEHEAALQRAVTAWIVNGLFMLLPGIFLGAWNLSNISEHHTGGHLAPSWLQPHGHAQIFSWIGSFILGNRL